MVTACVICPSRDRHRDLDHGHVCRPCENALRNDINQILDLVTVAATAPDPMASSPDSGGPRPVPASKPPLDVARIDPEMTLVLADKDDPSSAVPLLVLLEEWERMIREEREMAPYGPATVRRGATEARTAVPDTRVTLAGVTGFLAASVPWMCQTPDFPIEQLADQIRRATGALRMYDRDRERSNVWKVPCPADHDGGVCAFDLHVAYGIGDLHQDIHCPQCASTWTPLRLLLVALADERVVIWGYADTIKDALNIPRATLHRWAERGLVDKRGTMYDVGQAHRYRDRAKAEA